MTLRSDFYNKLKELFFTLQAAYLSAIPYTKPTYIPSILGSFNLKLLTVSLQTSWFILCDLLIILFIYYQINISYHYYPFIFYGFQKGNFTETKRLQVCLSFDIGPKEMSWWGTEELNLFIRLRQAFDNCWHSLRTRLLLLRSTIKLVPHIKNEKMIYYRPSPYQRFNLHLYSTTEKISLSIGSYPNTSYPKRVICRRSPHRINQTIHYSTNSWRIDYLQLSPTIQIIVKDFLIFTNL